jgi:hypothetical protein
LHIIKLEPHSLDNEKIKKKRERRRYNMGDIKCKNGHGCGSGRDPQLARPATHFVSNLSPVPVSGL